MKFSGRISVQNVHIVMQQAVAGESVNMQKHVTGNAITYLKHWEALDA